MSRYITKSVRKKADTDKQVSHLPKVRRKTAGRSPRPRRVKVRCIPLDRLVPHPDTPNRMSRVKLGKLVDNIRVTGCYEPLVVRPCPKRRGCYQIINGHHRCEALRQLGRKTADTIVWDVDDEQTDILLTTLNRLHGQDSLDKKLAVLRRLGRRVGLHTMASLLPQTRGQIERLIQARRLSQARRGKAPAFAIPVVFFVSEAQQSAVEEALAAVPAASAASTRAARRAAALTQIARQFLDHTSSSVKREMEDAAP